MHTTIRVDAKTYHTGHCQAVVEKCLPCCFHEARNWSPCQLHVRYCSTRTWTIQDLVCGSQASDSTYKVSHESLYSSWQAEPPQKFPVVPQKPLSEQQDPGLHEPIPRPHSARFLNFELRNDKRSSAAKTGPDRAVPAWSSREARVTGRLAFILNDSDETEAIYLERRKGK